MKITLLFAAVLIAIGLGLIGYAWLGEHHAHGFGDVLYFSLGVVLCGAGVVVALAAVIIRGLS